MFSFKRALWALFLFIFSIGQAVAVVSVPHNGTIVLNGISTDADNDRLIYLYKIFDTDGQTMLYEFSGNNFSISQETLTEITERPDFDINNVYEIELSVTDKMSLVKSVRKPFSIFMASDVLIALTSISAGATHTCASTIDGEVLCWGRNNYGQLGNGTKTNSGTPVKVLNLNNVSQVVASNSYSCALHFDGSVSCWGRNHRGQLGNETTTDSSTPVNVQHPLERAFTTIALGNNHTCSVDDENNGYCWGHNNYGKLGVGDKVGKNTPTKVLNLDGALSYIAPSQQGTCSLTTDGESYCWGRNNYGQFGDGTTTAESLVPVKTLGLTKELTAVQSGAYHSCGIDVDNDVVCWGRNNKGQLGNGTKTTSRTPVAVTGTSGNVSTIELGYYHSCFTYQTGAVSCWGQGNSGELGNSASVDATTPQPVTGLNSGVVSVSGGTSHTCSIKTSGQAHCWGKNNNGQTGNGGNTNINEPAEVQIQF